MNKEYQSTKQSNEQPPPEIKSEKPSKIKEWIGVFTNGLLVIIFIFGAAFFITPRNETLSQSKSKLHKISNDLQDELLSCYKQNDRLYKEIKNQAERLETVTNRFVELLSRLMDSFDTSCLLINKEQQEVTEE